MSPCLVPNTDTLFLYGTSNMRCLICYSVKLPLSFSSCYIDDILGSLRTTQQIYAQECLRVLHGGEPLASIFSLPERVF